MGLQLERERRPSLSRRHRRFSDVETSGVGSTHLKNQAPYAARSLGERFSPVAMRPSATDGRDFSPREGNGNARQGRAEQLPASASRSG